jgi:hypothetical protein
MWSLGVLLFNLLYGYTPFMAYNVSDTLSLIEFGFNPEEPTTGHVNSFPEFFDWDENSNNKKKTNKSNNGDKNSKSKRDKNKSGEKTQKNDKSTKTNNKHENTPKEPLIQVKFDDQDDDKDDDVFLALKQKDNEANLHDDSDSDYENGKKVFKSTVKPGTYLKTVQQLVMDQYKEIPHVSSYAKDLICRLLVQDPLQRLSATEVLNHPFFFTNLKHLNLKKSTSKPSLLESFGSMFQRSTSKDSLMGSGQFNQQYHKQQQLPQDAQQSTSNNNKDQNDNGDLHASILALQSHSQRSKLKRLLLRELVDHLTEEDIKNWQKRLLMFHEKQVLLNQQQQQPPPLQQQQPHQSNIKSIATNISLPTDTSSNTPQTSDKSPIPTSPPSPASPSLQPPPLDHSLSTPMQFQTDFESTIFNNHSSNSTNLNNNSDGTSIISSNNLQHTQLQISQSNVVDDSLQPTTSSLGTLLHAMNNGNNSNSRLNYNGDNEDDETSSQNNGTNDNGLDTLSYSSYMTGNTDVTTDTLSIAPSTSSTPYWKVGSLDVIKLFNHVDSGPNNNIFATPIPKKNNQPETTTHRGSSRQNNSNINNSGSETSLLNQTHFCLFFIPFQFFILLSSFLSLSTLFLSSTLFLNDLIYPALKHQR